MRQTIFAGAAIALIGSVASLPSAFVGKALAEPATFAFDKGHTEIRMHWNHAGMSEQSAEFLDFDGTLVFDRDDLAASVLNVTIPAASIHTGFELFDGHIKGADFFDVENHPEITFKSTSVRQTANNGGAVTGDLTIKGVTREVVLDVTLNYDGEHPLGAFVDAYKGVRYVSFEARTNVLRSDFNMGAYAPLTSDKVEIVISTEMAEQG